MHTDDFKDFSGLTKQLICNRTKDDKKPQFIDWILSTFATLRENQERFCSSMTQTQTTQHSTHWT